MGTWLAQLYRRYQTVPQKTRRRFLVPMGGLVFLALVGAGLFFAWPTQAVPGDFAIYRESAGFETITTSTTLLDFDTTVSEGTGFSIDGGDQNVTLSEQGHYLAMYNLAMESISGTARSEIQGNLTLSGYTLPYGRSSCYIRRTEGVDECWTAGAAIIESTSTDATIGVETYRTDSASDGVRRRANDTGFMLVRLDDDWDFARVREVGGGQAFNTGAFSTVTWDTNDELDSGYSRSSGDITLVESGHYLVTYNLALTNSSTGRRNNMTRLTLDGWEYPGTRGTTYLRGSDGVQDGQVSWAGIIEATTTNQVLRLQGACSGEVCGNVTNTPGLSGITIAKLPDTADYISLGYSADDQLIDVTNDPFDWDTQYEVDGSAFSHSTTSNSSRVNIDQDGDYLFFGSFFTNRTSTTDGSRQQPHWEWRTNGSTVATYGSFARFNRGDQSTTGAWTGGSSGGMLFPSLTDSDYIELLATDEATGDDPLGYFVGDALGVQGVRLASLITPDITVSTLGSQEATTTIPSVDFYLGGTFVLRPGKGDETVTDITITETGTIDASADISDLRLYYELDTSSPHNCQSESYDGGETQFGATSTGGFGSANGTSTFSGSVVTGTSSTMCVYVVMDVDESAYDGETIDVEISNPSVDVVISDGFIAPETAVALSGSTTLLDDELTQIHYHWRNDNGTEGSGGATSATGGNEDTILSNISVGTRKRVRIEISNEGSVESASTTAKLEYALRSSTCDVATGWTDVGAVGGAWDMQDSPNLTEGSDTTNIDFVSGGVTDENTTFLTPNGGVRDTTSETSTTTLASDEFVEVEYSVVPTVLASDGATYCFRTTNGGTPYANYSVYAEATIAADMVVSATGTQVTAVDIGTSDLYLGGTFVLTEQAATRTVDAITITENGTVDASANLSQIRLYYEMDTSSPYNCASESYSGTETQYGATSSAFSSANGTSTFTGSVLASTTAAMCVYAVLDVGTGASDSDTIELEIASPGGGDVVVSSGSVNPNDPVSLDGTTLINKAVLEQVHYHWRSDDGSEAGASSATGGTEDTPTTKVHKTETQRLRIEVSNEGSTTSTSTLLKLQYAEEAASCAAVGSWTDIDTPGGAWVLSDSIYLTDGADTTNIAEADGGVTNENTTFVTPNGAVKDVYATSGPYQLTDTEYLELEYSLEPTANASFGTTYCFRLVGNDTALETYSVYPQATIVPNQDFYIQRGTITLGASTSTTITAGTDYVAPAASTSAFIRITNTQHTGAGRNSLGGNQDPDTVTVYIENPSTIETSATFVHAATNMNTHIDWEIIEYTGPLGGDNEMIVRAQEHYDMASGDLTGSIAVSNVSDDNQMAIFITGQGSPDASAGNFNRGIATADWDDVSDEVDLTRNESGTAVTFSFAAVEFTGPNWVIQRAEHTYSAAGTWENEAINPVNDLSRTFIHTQLRSANPGLDEFGQEVYLSNVSTVRFQLEAGANVNHTGVAWVIENTQTSGSPMQVWRSNGTQAGGSEPSIVNVNIGTTTPNLTNTSIFTNNRVTGTGTAFPRPIMGVKLISTTQYRLWVSDTGQTRTYRTEVVEWPTAELFITQNYYQFYDDNDALDPTDPWPPGPANIGENAAITVDDQPLGTGDVVRIRMSLAASGANLSRDTYSFNLQWGERTTTCGAITEWNDIADSSSTTAPWRGYNTTVADGTVLGSNPPGGGELNLSVSDRAGSYEEANPTATNTYRVLIGEDIEYDWALEANSITELAVYCFRMTHESGTELDAYTYYPTLRTSGYQVDQYDWQWFDDEASLTPSSALAASNTAPSNIAQGNAIKLRVALEELSGKSGLNTKFKLQYSESSDFSVVNDVVDMDQCTKDSKWCYFDGAGTDNATVTATVLDGVDSCIAGVGDGCGTHNEYPYAPLYIGEVGTTSVNNAGGTVNLQHTYTDPIFIVEAITGDATGGAGNRPAAAIITATSTSSFTVRIQEPDSEPDTHGFEEVAYLVMERGAHQLPDGTRLDANSTTTLAYFGNGVSGDSDDTCVYTQTFSSIPVVLAGLQSNNNTGTPDFFTASIDLITATDFACAIEVADQETNAPTSVETYGWVAIEPGVFTNNSIAYEATSTSVSVTGWDTTPWYEQAFFETFANTPGIVATKQDRLGADGGWVRYDNASTTAVQLAIEEADGGGERAHIDEPVGYMAFSGPDVIFDEGGNTNFTFAANARKEFEFTIEHYDADPNKTYFFRVYDVTNDIVVTPDASSTNPSLATQSATLTFSISGVGAGSSTEGIVTDVATTPTTIPFGSLTLDVDKIAAQRLTVTTNATEGYQILAFERQDLTSQGATINDITGTNPSPVAWTTGCTVGAQSCFGYHAGDNTLAGGSTRFLIDDTYAALDGNLAEVAYSSVPVTDEETDIVYRIQAGTGQPAGLYESKIVYIVVPIF